MPLGSLSVHYDCSDVSSLRQNSDGTGPMTTVGQPIGRISDLSGNGRHATATGSAKASYQPDILGGLSVARGNGTSTAMVVPASAVPVGAHTIYAVAVPRGVGRLFNAREIPGNAVRTLISANARQDADPAHHWLVAASGGGGLHIVANEASKGQPIVLGQPRVFSLAAGTLEEGARIRLDDGPRIFNPDETTRVNPYAVSGTATHAALFASIEAATSNFGRWDLAELRIYPGYPTDAEDAAIREALAAKWGTPTRTPGTYAELAVRSLDAIRSTGPWGDDAYPVFPSAFERTTATKMDARPPVPLGKRDRDRSFGGDGTTTAAHDGSNPSNTLCHNLEREIGYLDLAWRLGGVRSTWADGVLGAMLDVAASTPRGLFPMGEHGAYKLEGRGTDSGIAGQPIIGSEGHLQYESNGRQLDLWPRMAALDPAALLGCYEGIWEHGFSVAVGSRTPGNLNGSRHIDMVGATANLHGHLFPRVLGEYLRGFLWASVHDSPNASTWHDRAELLLDHLLRQGSAPGTAPNLVRMHGTTKALNAQNGMQTRFGVNLGLIHWTSNTLQLASALEDALAEPGIPTGIRAKMETLLGHCDDVALAVSHDFAGGGFAAQTGWSDLTIVYAGSDSWATAYGALSTAERMGDVIDRWRRASAAGRSAVASGYAAQITAAADRYLADGLPSPGTITYPGAYAAAIGLMLAAHEVDGEGGHLAFAEAVADRAIVDCFDVDSDIPRASSAHGWYESLTGGPALVLALHDLQIALDTPDPTPELIPGTLSAGTPSQTSVTLTWTDATGGQGALSAQLEWRFAGEGEWAEIWEATTSPVTDDELEPGTSYEYRVRWTDEADQVVTSNTVGVTAAEEPEPDPIVAGTLSAGTPTATSVTLTWTVAAGGQGALSARLQRSSATPDDWADLPGATSSPVEDSGLSPESSYRYRVRWTDEADQVATSDVVTVTTPDEPVIPPEEFAPGGMPSLQVVTAISATIAWESPTGGVGPIVEQLQIRVGDGPWLDVPGATSSPATIDGLAPATSHTVRVLQTDLGGE